MKTVGMLVFGLLALAPFAAAADNVEVYQCPMDGYTAPVKCPRCGMDMEKKTLSAADYQAAVDKQQADMKGRPA